MSVLTTQTAVLCFDRVDAPNADFYTKFVNLVRYISLGKK